MPAALAKTRPIAFSEIVLWVGLFLLTFFFAPLLTGGSSGDGWRMPLLAAELALPAKLLALGGLILLGIGSALLGERYLLIEKGERVTMLLFLLAFFTTTPSFGATTAVALFVSWLLLFLQLGTYQDTHQRHAYLIQGLLTGVLALLHPLYLVLLPILLWGGYHLRSLSLRSIVALVVGLFLPLWIILPILALQATEVLEQAYHWWASSASLPQLSRGIQLTPSLLTVYLLFIGLYLLGALLYRGRYYRESVRHRDMSSALKRHVLLLLLLFPLGGQGATPLLPLLFLPLSLLLARGLSTLSYRLVRWVRLLLLLACLASYLYQLGLLEALWKRFF